MYDTLLPLIRKTRSNLSPAEFHEVVNVVFHDVEAAHYDEVHADMWSSLGRQAGLLAGDLSGLVADGAKLLDVGCGTGLSTQLILDSSLGAHIGSVTLADTSAKMLERARLRADGWKIPAALQSGPAESIEGKYDVILICSVLHHIPDIKKFLSTISALQDPGGVIIHLQDPNGDYLQDPQYLARRTELESARHRNFPKRIFGIVPKGTRLAAKRFLGMRSYIDEVNDRLLEKRAIAKRMTEEEIWSVTDIHVDGLPYSIGSGISLRKMANSLKDYRLVSSRSYGFFGYLESELPEAFQIRERELIDHRGANGRYLAATWVKS